MTHNREFPRNLSIIFTSSQVLTMQQELTPSELTVLHGSARESPITEEFFSVVSKVQVGALKAIYF